ncbi:MAG: hypothetical protein J3R72DRAFT_418243 [Linnemannia gamsii]|nr:MAG: hypothetical protein J3R72DRAFT_418243 [Linnemannia gamsii]
MLTFELSSSNSTYSIRAILQHNQDQCRTNLDQWNRMSIKKRRPTLYNFSPLRELSLLIGHALNVSLDTFPFPTPLTSLELKIRYLLETQENLTTCLLLERLTTEACEMDCAILCWINMDCNNQPAPLPLRALTLRHVPFRQCYLENLLLFTPTLKEPTLMTPDWAHCPEYNLKGLWTT